MTSPIPFLKKAFEPFQEVLKCAFMYAAQAGPASAAPAAAAVQPAIADVCSHYVKQKESVEQWAKKQPRQFLFLFDEGDNIAPDPEEAEAAAARDKNPKVAMGVEGGAELLGRKLGELLHFASNEGYALSIDSRVRSHAGRRLAEGGDVDVLRVPPLPGRYRRRPETEHRVPNLDHAAPRFVGAPDSQVSARFALHSRLLLSHLALRRQSWGKE